MVGLHSQLQTQHLSMGPAFSLLRAIANNSDISPPVIDYFLFCYSYGHQRIL